MSDDPVVNADLDAVERLKALLLEPKFTKYTGKVWDGQKLVNAGEIGTPVVDRLVQRLLDDVPRNPRKSVVMAAFADALAAFPQDADTDDREQFLSYFENIMDILGIESSDGLLMDWMYGNGIASVLAQPKS